MGFSSSYSQTGRTEQQKYKYKQKQNKTASVMCRLPVNARECINGYKLLYGHVFCGENWWELLTGGNCFYSNV